MSRDAAPAPSPRLWQVLEIPVKRIGDGTHYLRYLEVCTLSVTAPRPRTIARPAFVRCSSASCCFQVDPAPRRQASPIAG